MNNGFNTVLFSGLTHNRCRNSAQQRVSGFRVIAYLKVLTNTYFLLIVNLGKLRTR